VEIAIVGLGNAILSDDAAGLEVADAAEALLRPRPLPPGTTLRFARNETGGLSLLDDLAGADIAILVDAVVDSGETPGTPLWWLRDEAGDWGPADPTRADPRIAGVERRSLFSSRFLGTHGHDFFALVRFATRSQIPLPRQVWFLGLSVEDVRTFSEECTPAVARAIVPWAESVAALVERLASV
jgi:hydrogenase maturation protease